MKKKDNKEKAKTKKNKTTKKIIESISVLKFEDVYNNLKKFCEENKHEYLVVASNPHDEYCVVLKKQELTTKHINNNNPFQPYEKIETKYHPIMFLIWNCPYKIPASDEPAFIKEMRKFQAKILKVYHLELLEEKIKQMFDV
jgi:hypothetical protein